MNERRHIFIFAVPALELVKNRVFEKGFFFTLMKPLLRIAGRH